MRNPFRWFATRFRELDLLPEYFSAAATRWQELLWGGSVVAVIWGLYFILGNPPSWVNWLAVLLGLFVAGYYVWRADHTRLMPKFEIKQYKILPTPTAQINVHQTYVQVLPKCLTDAPVRGCQGHLLRVYKKSGDEENWQATAINEPLALGWSTKDTSPLTLQPGIDQRLNVCFRDNYPTARIMPATNDFTPMLWGTIPNPTGTFRFEIRVTASDCPPVDISVDVTFDECEWDKPIVNLTQGFTSNPPSPAH
jgi:hypothetical protein